MVRIRRYECDARGREIPGTAYVLRTKFRTADEASAVIGRVVAALETAGCRPGVRRFEVVEAQ